MRRSRSRRSSSDAARRPSLDRFIGGTLTWGLVALLALSPLPLASNRLWSWSLFGVLGGVLVLLWGLQIALSSRPRIFFPPGLWLPAALYVLVCVFIGLQAACFTPSSWHHEVWSMASPILGPAECPAVSLYPSATWTALARLIAYGVFFWLFLQTCRAEGVAAARRIVLIAALAPAANALYGLMMTLTGLDLIFWYEKWAYVDVVTGTFVNRNSFAVFLGMGAVVNFAVLLDAVVTAMSRTRTDVAGFLRSGAVSLLERHYLYLGALVLCLAGVVLTASRAGLAATILGLIAITLVHSMRKSMKLRWAAVTGLMVLALVLVMVAAGGRALESRLIDSEGDFRSRATVIGTTLEATADSPWLGVGYGTFAEAWQFYRPESIKSKYYQTHSTYVENMFELGVPAALMLDLCVLLVVLITLKGVRRRRKDNVLPALAFSAALVPILHSAIDFSLQIPAITFYLVALLGMGVAESYSSARRDSHHAADGASG